MRVHAALNKWQRRPFAYGDADCCQFIAFVVKELTGTDYSAGFYYETEAQAEMLVNKEGDLVDFLHSVFGITTDSPEDGDPCVIKIPIVGQVGGIKLRNDVVCLTKNGMIQIPDRYLVASWRV